MGWRAVVKKETSIKAKANTAANDAKIANSQLSQWIASRKDADRIAVEVLPLTNYIPSDPEHQDRLTRCPEDTCHIPKSLLHKYKWNPKEFQGND